MAEGSRVPINRDVPVPRDRVVIGRLVDDLCPMAAREMHQFALLMTEWLTELELTPNQAQEALGAVDADELAKMTTARLSAWIYQRLTFLKPIVINKSSIFKIFY